MIAIKRYNIGHPSLPAGRRGPGSGNINRRARVEKHMTDNSDKDNREIELGKAEIEAEPVAAAELAEVREQEKAPAAPKAGNVFIGTLNIFTQPLKTVMDPVKKVCYEPLQLHWEEKYRKKYPKGAHWVLLLDLFLLSVVGALVVGGIFAYFVMPAFPQPRSINLQVLSPKTVISGAPVTFTIAYSNETDGRLAGAELGVRLPDGFIEDAPAGEGTPVDDAAAKKPAATSLSKSFKLGALDAHGRGEVRISGTVYGPVGAEKTLISELYYWKEGDTKPSRAASYHSWIVENSVLGMTFRMEDEVIRGRQNAVTISYSNQSEEVIPAAVIRLTTPDDFIVTGTSPRMTGRNDWLITDLDAGAKGAVTVYGILRAGAGKNAVPNFTVRGYLVRDGVRQQVQEIRQNVATLATGFEITQDIGRPGGKVALVPGEQLKVTIHFRNGGSKAVTGIQIDLEPTARFLADPEAVYSWGPDKVPELARLEPGQSGLIIAELRLRPDIDTAAVSGESGPVMDVSTRARYFLEDEPGQAIYADTAVMSLPISTLLTVKASAVYHTKDGEQLGVGPVPPQAGQTTRYWVFIQVGNTTSEVRNARLEATLPANVTWTGHYSVTSGQPLTFLPVTGQLVWEVGTVPPFANGGSRIGASFELAITPDKEDVGTVPVLVENIKIDGFDALTETKLFAGADNVTTKVPYGTDAAKAGVVTE